MFHCWKPDVEKAQAPLMSLYFALSTRHRCMDVLKHEQIYMKIHCRGKNRKVDIWFERLYSAAQPEVSEDAMEGLGIVGSSSGTVWD